jgi:cytochrome P450
MVMVSDAASAHAVIDHTFEKGSAYSYLYPWLGHGVLTDNNETRYRVKRHALQPAFHFKSLDAYARVFLHHVQHILYGVPDEHVVDFTARSSDCSLQIMCAAAFGEHDSVQAERLAYLRNVQRASAYFYDRVFDVRPDSWYLLTPQGRAYRHACNEMRAFVDTLVHERKQHTTPAQDDFLSQLLTMQHELSLTDTEVRDEANTFVFEGHDTTSQALVWCMYYLCKYLEHQRAISEALPPFHAVETKERREAWFKEVRACKPLRHFIKEVLRVRPSVPVVTRRTTYAVETPSHVVPANVQVAVNVVAVHHDANVWEEPEAFRPERHKEHQTVPYAFLPFSANTRTCIGQRFAMLELQVMLAYMVCTSTWAFADEHTANMMPCMGMITRGDRPLLVRRRAK